MSKWLIVGICLFLLAGCREEFLSTIPSDIPYRSRDLQGVLTWVASWVTYAPDEYRPQGGTWSPPEETYQTRAGDCEDSAILVLFLAERDCGIEGELLIGDNAELGRCHAWIEVDGEWWNGVTGTVWTGSGYVVKERMSLEEALSRCDPAPTIRGLPR